VRLTNETPRPRHARRRKKGKKKGKTRRNEEKKAHLEMKHQARNKKNAKKIAFMDLLDRVLPILTQYPTSLQAPFLRKSGQPLNQPPKPPTQHTRDKKAGASALFNTISTLQPLKFFFFSKISPLF
jgi:hypothetical protein